MATDGTKIIDSDNAHDVYWGIMNLYDDGADLELIEQTFPLQSQGYYDDFDNEIYITACGLAYWELGLMTQKRLHFIKQTIEKEAGIKLWAEYSEKDAKDRKNVLKRYLTKISKENQKIRQRKKYRKVKHFVYSENSVLTFQLQNGNYAVTICAKIEQHRGHCNYWLIPTTFQSKEKPQISDIKQVEFLGRTIATGYGREQCKIYQPNIDKIWEHIGSEKHFALGLVIDAISHKEFKELKHTFEKIGELEIMEGFKKVGSFGGFISLEHFTESYADLENRIKVFRCQKFSIRLIIN